MIEFVNENKDDILKIIEDGDDFYYAVNLSGNSRAFDIADIDELLKEVSNDNSITMINELRESLGEDYYVYLSLQEKREPQSNLEKMIMVKTYTTKELEKK